MEDILRSAKGLRLLVGLNLDRLLTAVAVVAALWGGALVGTWLTP